MAQFNFEKAIQGIPEFHKNADIFHDRVGAKEKITSSNF